MTTEKIKELDALLTRECGKYEADCSTCPFQKECQSFCNIPSELLEKAEIDGWA